MLEYLYEWLQNIAFYLVMVTVVTHLIPEPEYKKYIRFFTGLILVLMLASPILKLLGMGDPLQELPSGEEYQKQVEKMKEASKYLEEINAEDYLGDVWENEEVQETDTNSEADTDQGSTAESVENPGQKSIENSDIRVEDIRIGTE